MTTTVRTASPGPRREVTVRDPAEADRDVTVEVVRADDGATLSILYFDPDTCDRLAAALKSAAKVARANGARLALADARAADPRLR